MPESIYVSCIRVKAGLHHAQRQSFTVKWSWKLLPESDEVSGKKRDLVVGSLIP